MARLEAILFDIDDTLYSTTEFAARARRNAVRAMIEAGLDLPEEVLLKELDEVLTEFSSNYEHHFDKLLQRLRPSSLARVNPALEVRAFDHFGADNVAAVLEGVDVAVNGMDELPACLRLWRAARERNIPVVDAWSAPLPNVFVLRPEDPPPEEFLEYPTRGLAPEELTPEIVDECKLREALHVSLHTRSLRYLDFEIVKEIMTGKRARISFAPMVWGAGLMMAWEALKLRLGRGRVASRFGRFWDPWRGDARDARGFNGVELAIIKRALALKARFGA